GTLIQFSPPSIDAALRTTLPSTLASARAVPLPLHTVVAWALAVPPTLAGPTDTSTSLDVALGQLPLCTTARYLVATLSGPVGNRSEERRVGKLSRFRRPSIDAYQRTTIAT